MHLRRFVASALILIPAFFFITEQANAVDDSVVIVYKDGHRQTLASTQIVRIELKAPASIVYKDGHQEKVQAAIERIEFGEAREPALPGRAHYIGKWEVGDGAGGKFHITLYSDGDARKSIGSAHGTWTLVDGEAHIAWDDGWRDIIRKKGSAHEKLAFEPGKSFGDTPSNVAEARSTEKKSI